MKLDEVLLIIGALIVLIVPGLMLRRIKQPLKTYIKLGSAVLLLILVWLLGNGDAPFHVTMPPKLILTGIAISSITKAIKEYKRATAPTVTENN